MSGRNKWLAAAALAVGDMLGYAWFLATAFVAAAGDMIGCYLMGYRLVSVCSGDGQLLALILILRLPVLLHFPTMVVVYTSSAERCGGCVRLHVALSELVQAYQYRHPAWVEWLVSWEVLCLLYVCMYVCLFVSIFISSFFAAGCCC